MSLTLEEVQHIANLARLDLSKDEMMRFRGQLSAILDYFQQLESLETEDVSPTSSISEGQSALRADIAQPGLGLNELLHNAPASDDRLFRVPPIFE